MPSSVTKPGNSSTLDAGKPRKRPGKNYRDRVRDLARCKAILPLSPLEVATVSAPSLETIFGITIPELLREPEQKLPTPAEHFHASTDVLYIPVESSPEKFPKTPKKQSSTAKRALFQTA